MYLILSYPKVHELEAELASTQARTSESAKAYQRAERKCKELAFTAGEDKKNQDRMTDLAAKLQSKIKWHDQYCLFKNDDILSSFSPRKQVIDGKICVPISAAACKLRTYKKTL